MGVLENRPFALARIGAFLALEVIARFEAAGVAEIFALFLEVSGSGRTPAARAFHRHGFVRAFAVPRQMHGRRFSLLQGMFTGDLMRPAALWRHAEHR
jgi:hypothetical protein